MSAPKLPSLPRLPTLPKPPWETSPAPASSGMAGGVVTASKVGWNFVEYAIGGSKTRFSAKPAVVALAEVRAGDFLRTTLSSIEIPEVTLPTVNLPGPSAVILPTVNLPGTSTVTLPTVNLPPPSKIPRIERDDFNSKYYCDLVGAHARDAAKNLSPPWPLDTIWNWFCDTLVYGMFSAATFGIGFIFNVFWDSFLQPQVTKIETEIDGVISGFRDRTQDAINVFRSRIQIGIDLVMSDFRNKAQDAFNTFGAKVEKEIDRVMSDFRDKAQAAFNTFGANMQNTLNALTAEMAGKINDGLSDVIPTLYEMMNLAPGQLITPVNTRNVTTTGFEYYALSEDQVTHYIALGTP